MSPQIYQCQKNLIKGRMILVKGCLANDDYKDKQGAVHKKTIIKATIIEFLDSRKILFTQSAAPLADINQAADVAASGNEETSTTASSVYPSALDIPNEEIPF